MGCWPSEGEQRGPILLPSKSIYSCWDEQPEANSPDLLWSHQACGLPCLLRDQLRWHLLLHIRLQRRKTDAASRRHWGVDVNKDATKAATGAADFSAKVWDALSGEEELTLQHKHIVKSVNFSNDSAALATASNDKVLRIFDLEQPSEPIVKFEGHTSGIKQVMYTPDNKQLLSCSDDKTVRMWDTATGGEIKKIDFDTPIGGVELAKEGDVLTVATGSKVIFYEADTFKGHFGPVHCVRFSPDGELYASGSEDGTLRLWQTEVGKTYGLWKCIDTLNEGVTKPEAVVS